MRADDQLGEGPSAALQELAAAIDGCRRCRIELDVRGKVRGIVLGDDGDLIPSPLTPAQDAELSRIADVVADRPRRMLVRWGRPGPVSWATLGWRPGGRGGSRVLGRGAIICKLMHRRSIARHIAGFALPLGVAFAALNGLVGLVDLLDGLGTDERNAVFARMPWVAHPMGTASVLVPALAIVLPVGVAVD